MFSTIPTGLLSTWAVTMFQWLAALNDATSGLLDMVMAAIAAGPAIFVLWSYLSKQDSSDA